MIKSLGVSQIEFSFKYNNLYRFNVVEHIDTLLNNEFKYNNLYRFNQPLLEKMATEDEYLNTTICIGSIYCTNFNLFSTAQI